MTDARVFGPLVSGSRVRRAVLETSHKWLHTYLAEVERQNGYDAGDLGKPRSWRRPPDIWKIGDQQSPAMMVLPPVWQGQPDREGGSRGTSQFTWRIAVAVVVNVGNADPDWAGMVVEDYLAAEGALLEQKRSLGGVASDTRLMDMEAALLSQQVDQRQRSIAAGSVTATVVVRDALRRFDGPLEVPDDPYVDPGEWGQVEDVSTDINQSDQSEE